MGGNIYFIRPPYKASNNSAPAKNKILIKLLLKKKRTEISFTIDDNETIYPEFIPHQIVLGNDRGHSPKGVTVRNAGTMCSVQDMYFDRQKYIKR